MTRPSSRFIPDDLYLVTCTLDDKVAINKKGSVAPTEEKEEGFIKTMNVYKDEPWRLDHDPNPVFKRNEWYYFVPRTKRGGKTANRSVPRIGESEGGTWRASTKTNIVNEDRVLVGYRRDFVYNKTVNGTPVKTNWHMAEYSLHKADAEFQELVLCWIRDQEKVGSEFKFVPPEEEDSDEEDGFANQIEMMMMQEGEPGDVNQQPEREREDDDRFANEIEMMMMQDGEPGFDDDTISPDLIMRILNEDV